jgi:hypothetical protein
MSALGELLRRFSHVAEPGQSSGRLPKLDEYVSQRQKMHWREKDSGAGSGESSLEMISNFTRTA